MLICIKTEPAFAPNIDPSGKANYDSGCVLFASFIPAGFADSRDLGPITAFAGLDVETTWDDPQYEPERKLLVQRSSEAVLQQPASTAQGDCFHTLLG